MKKELESTKVFYDILFDYLNLKYIFEYGFNWSDEAAEHLMNRSSQKARELANLLGNEIYEVCISAPRWMYTSEKTKKSGRRLIKNNHYRLVQNRWAEELFARYGAYNDSLATKYIESCGNGSYIDCRNNDTLCALKRVCQTRSEQDFFRQLCFGMPQNDKVYWGDRPLYVQMLRQYKDVIEEGKEYRLKRNEWVFSKAKAHPVFESEEEYDKFLHMIRFFSDFAPLSVIGANFYRRLKKAQKEDYILIRNLPFGFELEQEYIYRALYAIINNLTVIYEDMEYVPIRVEYRNRALTGIKEKLYLLAKRIKWIDGKMKLGETEYLELTNGLYLTPGDNTYKKTEAETGIKEKTSSVTNVIVDFYYNSKTDYLIRRRRDGWTPAKWISTENQALVMKSPYYPEDTVWSCDREVYQVAEEDLAGFYDFVNSFGDFAKLISEPKEISESPVIHSIQGKGKIKEYQSLLSVYNSNALIESIETPLPPRNVELEWVMFVLKNYPQMCSLFLSDELKDRLHNALLKKVENKGWFLEENFRYCSRVKDLFPGVVEKYRNVMEAVDKKRVLMYAHKNQPVRIFPYALEYDVVSHITGSTREPIDIMCYSLDEKPNISILFKDIRTTDQCSQEEFEFDEYDKLYHILAYAVRCAVEERQETDVSVMRIISKIWKEDPRGGDNYNRCIRKRLKKATDYPKAYDAFSGFAEKHGDKRLIAYQKNVFRYWNEQADNTLSLQYQYQTLLLSCFHAACEALYHPDMREGLLSLLEHVTSPDIWRFISGQMIDDIPNEIAFYNEKMKNASISFYLKEGYGYMIDQIYRLFRDFVCVGDLKKDGIQFTVTYEQFYYRKIHMLLMVIADKIHRIAPQEIAEILAARLNNKEKN